MSSIRDFVPLSKLGEGTFSTVYKVRRLSDQKVYALKKVRMNNLSQKQKQNALNQIRILASFQCENIVAYKEAFFDDKLQVLCIVMQYADSGDLHRYISNAKKDSKKISQITIWKIAADILSALEHLHAKGILHRDIKCANIFIHGDEYKLGDLNVSKVNGGKLAYTQTGTPYYASPEVWRDQPYDSKSDIWSIGCILYELACLKPPFQGKDMDQLYKNVQKNSYTPIPQDYSLELTEVIDKCLQKNPKNRPKASQLLEHAVISRFKNRRQIPVEQKVIQNQLLKTIKLPNDLRSLKMNLPGSKYDDEKNSQAKDIKANMKYASDRPSYPNKSALYSNNNAGSANRNESYLDVVKQDKIDKIQSPKSILNNEAFLSPRSIKKSYQNYSYNRSPEDIITRKIASAHISSSDKKANYSNLHDYTDRRNSIEANQIHNQNYSDRRVYSQNHNKNNQKNSSLLQKYDKFIQQQLEKRPAVMPRTQKRIVNNQSKYHSQNPSYVPTPQNLNYQKKEVEEWKRKLTKKSRVFSNNIFGNRPVYGNSQIK